MKQPGSHWTDFHEIWYFMIFRNVEKKFMFHQNPTRITGTLHDDQYTFIVIPCSVLFRMRNVSDKSCRENKNTHVILNNLFVFENRAVCEVT